MAERSVWSRFQWGKLRATPSQAKTSLSGSPTTPVSSAISEFGILKVEAGKIASRSRGPSFVTMKSPLASKAAKTPAVPSSTKRFERAGRISMLGGAVCASAVGTTAAAARKLKTRRRLIIERSIVLRIPLDEAARYKRDMAKEGRQHTDGGRSRHRGHA